MKTELYRKDGYKMLNRICRKMVRIKLGFFGHCTSDGGGGWGYGHCTDTGTTSPIEYSVYCAKCHKYITTASHPDIYALCPNCASQNKK